MSNPPPPERGRLDDGDINCPPTPPTSISKYIISSPPRQGIISKFIIQPTSRPLSISKSIQLSPPPPPQGKNSRPPPPPLSKFIHLPRPISAGTALGSRNAGPPQASVAAATAVCSTGAGGSSFEGIGDENINHLHEGRLYNGSSRPPPPPPTSITSKSINPPPPPPRQATYCYSTDGAVKALKQSLETRTPMDFLNARGKKRSHFSGDDDDGLSLGATSAKKKGGMRGQSTVAAKTNCNEGEEEQQQRQGCNDGITEESIVASNTTDGRDTPNNVNAIEQSQWEVTATFEEKDGESVRVGKLFYLNRVTKQTTYQSPTDNLAFFSFFYNREEYVVWLPCFASLCITDLRWRIEDLIRERINILCGSCKIRRCQESAKLLPYGVKILDGGNGTENSVGTQEKPYKVSVKVRD